MPRLPFARPRLALRCRLRSMGRLLRARGRSRHRSGGVDQIPVTFTADHRVGIPASTDGDRLNSTRPLLHRAERNGLRVTGSIDEACLELDELVIGLGYHCLDLSPLSRQHWLEEARRH